MNNEFSSDDALPFYNGASRREFLSALLGHCDSGEVAVLEGDAGSGVSLLLEQLQAQAPQTLRIIPVDGEQPHDSGLVVNALLAHFGIEREQLAETLRETLAEQRLAVVVDNCESLDDAALATMAALKEKLGPKLGYLFAGAPGVAEKVASAGLVADNVLDLPALTLSEIQEFVAQQRGLQLTPEQAMPLLAKSAGQPGPLLTLLDEQAAAAPTTTAAIDEVELGEDAAAATAELSAEAPVPELDEPELPQSDAEADIAPDQDEEEDDFVVAGPATQSAFDEFDSEELEPDVESEFDFEQEQEEERAGWLLLWQRHGKLLLIFGGLLLLLLLWLLLRGGGETQEESRRSLVLPPPPVAAPDESAPVEESRGPRERTMEPVARLEDLQARQQEPVVVAEPPPEAAPQEAPQVSPPPQPVSQASAPTGYNREGWLRQLSDQRWFLQITATSQEESAQAVLDRLDRKGAYYPAVRNDKRVYLVLAGDYASRDAALAAREQLPQDLRDSGPFPRQMSDIRNEL